MGVRQPRAYSLSGLGIRLGSQTPLRPRIRHQHTYQLWTQASVTRCNILARKTTSRLAASMSPHRTARAVFELIESRSGDGPGADHVPRPTPSKTGRVNNRIRRSMLGETAST